MNTFLEPIQQADTWLLTLINFDGSTAYDQFWMLYTNRLAWIPLAVAGAYCLFRRGGWRHALLMVVILALLFALSDFVVASIIKPLVARPRPSHDPLVMPLLSFVNDYHGGRYGFPSNHASNGFAAATMLALLFRLAAFLFHRLYRRCYQRMEQPWALPPYPTLYAGREPWPIILIFYLTVAVLLLGSLVR